MPKIAIVTGAAQGIGEACVNILTDRGYSVIGVDVNRPKSTLASDFHLVDLADPAAIKRFADAMHKKHSAVHVLVNNAGLSLLKPLEFTTCAHWDLLMNVNTRAPFLMVKHLVPLLRKANGASVINFSCMHARETNTYSHAYAASKNAVCGLTRGLAAELAADGIRVNALLPGLVKTPLLKGLQPAQIEGLGRMIPAGSLGKPDDIAKVVAFLASSDAAYVTGTEMVVDGGVLCRQSMVVI